MESITIQLPIPLATVLAMSRGWTPTIDDETQEMVGDEYPQIPNPKTHIEFLEDYIPDFIQEYVLNEGRQKVITEFNSISDSIEHQVQHGAFDQLILKGDLEGIKDAVKATL